MVLEAAGSRPVTRPNNLFLIWMAGIRLGYSFPLGVLDFKQKTKKLMIPALFFPTIDPVLVSIGSLDIRWYGLMYLLGILFAWQYANWLIKKDPLTVTSAQTSDFISWTVIGIVVGGRLGWVLFYHPLYYLDHPLEIFMTWKGGMSFHGGLLGVMTALYFFSKKHKIQVLELMDLLALTVPMGISFGRLGNFINGEHWGRITDVPWGMIFPRAGFEPRHPSQLYEAFFEGLLIFILLNLANRIWALRRYYRGVLSGLFALLYGTARCFCEYFREPDGYFGGLTMGQAYSLPMIAVGAILIGVALRKSHVQKPT